MIGMSRTGLRRKPVFAAVDHTNKAVPCFGAADALII
jgi:hypothetical protein